MERETHSCNLGTPIQYSNKPEQNLKAIMLKSKGTLTILTYTSVFLVLRHTKNKHLDLKAYQMYFRECFPNKCSQEYHIKTEYL